MTLHFSSNLVQELVDLSIIDLSSVELYSSSTRDDPKQQVWRCKSSGVVFLEPKSKASAEQGSDLSYWGVEERDKFLAQSEHDDERRSKLITPYLDLAQYLDIGTGLGGILDRSAALCAKLVAVEPQKAARNTLQGLGYEVFADITEIEQSNFELISLFHVFEHLHQPMAMLKEVKQRLKPKGLVIIEVPHANDALLSHYHCEAFKQFTLWSEHLVLHTKTSLQIMLEAAGFEIVSMQGQQRYDLANHLYWLSQGKPGGQNVWHDEYSQKAKNSYRDSLIDNNLSDTLLVIARG